MKHIYIGEEPVDSKVLAGLLLSLAEVDRAKLAVIRADEGLRGRLFTILVKRERFISVDDYLAWVRSGINAILGPEASA